MLNYSPAFYFEVKGFEFGLNVETGEVHLDRAVARDHSRRGAVVCLNGILVNDLLVFGLQSHKDSDCVTA